MKNTGMKYEFLESALDAVNAMVAIKNLDGMYIYANRVVDEHYKKEFDSIVGMTYKEIYPLSEQKVIEMLDNEVIEKKSQVTRTIKVHTDSGYIYVDSSRAPVFNSNNEIIGVISVGQDVTERELTKKKLEETIKELEIMNQKYHELSYKDELTKIYNRRKFYDDFQKLDCEEEHVLVMVDLNNFKFINDEFGHSCGDKALISFAKEIQNRAKERGGNAYRLGGDEFTLVYPNMNVSFEKELQSLNELLQKTHKQVSVAFGEITIKSTEELDTIYRDLCVKRADKLLYEFKELSKK